MTSHDSYFGGFSFVLGVAISTRDSCGNHGLVEASDVASLSIVKSGQQKLYEVRIGGA